MLRITLAMALALAAQTETKPGAIEGTVVNEVTGEPVARAVVSAVPSGRTPVAGNRGMSGAPQGFTTIADAEGRYQLGNLPPGSYTVMARKRGFLDPGGVRFRGMARVSVEAGQTKGGLVCKLAPQGIIAGRVFDEFNEPVQGAQVQAVAKRRSRGREVWSEARSGGSTNDRGEFRLSNLSPGQYVIAVQFHDQVRMLPAPTGARAEAYAVTYFPQAVEAEAAQPVEVAAGGETAGIDVHLQREATYRIQGRVAGPSGEAPKSFYVQVRPRERGARFGATGGGGVRINQDGTFEIQSVRRGSWVLVAHAQEPGSTEPAVGATTVEVGGQDISDVVIRITGGIAVSGSLVLEGGQQKANWNGFQISLTTPDGVSYSRMRNAKVNEDGSFTLTAEMPDKYMLRVSGPLPNSYLASIRIGPDEYLGREIDLSAGAPGPVRVIYRTDGGKVRCSIERAEGNETDAGEAVMLIPKEPELRQYPFMHYRPAANATSVELANVRPGEYLALAVANGDYRSLMEGDLPKEQLDEAVQVKVEASGTHAVSLKLIKAAQPQ